MPDGQDITSTRSDYGEEFEILDINRLSGEKLFLQYVPVSQAVLWEDNAKLHDIGAIIVSIEEHGFRDPPAWDAELNAVVEGNGRITALQMMEQQGKALPRGILKNDGGQWCVPMLFGIDAKSVLAAKRYGIDHNNLTMAGGDFTVWDIARMWDTAGYIMTLDELAAYDVLPVSLDYDDLQLIKDAELRKTGEMIDGEEEDGESGDGAGESSNNDNGDNSGNMAVLKVTVMNFNLVDDVLEAIELLLDDNPGWDAKVVQI